jgi:hypothetical protein
VALESLVFQAAFPTDKLKLQQTDRTQGPQGFFRVIEKVGYDGIKKDPLCESQPLRGVATERIRYAREDQL